MPHGNATWRTYANLFKFEGKDKLVGNDRINRFEQCTKQFAYPYIILSSKYFPTNVSSKKPYYVKKDDKDKDLEHKELFMYFIVENYNTKETQVDKSIRKFYKEVFHKNFNIDNYKEDPNRNGVVLVKK